MEAHYFVNDCFMRPNQLLDDAGKLAGIPGIIVQGRYDLLCPPATSQALAALARGRDPRRRKRGPYALRSRRPQCRDEGDRGYGVQSKQIGILYRNPPPPERSRRATDRQRPRVCSDVN